MKLTKDPMNAEEIGFKLHYLFLRADANGVGAITRSLWGLKDYLIPFVEEDCWEFRTLLEENSESTSPAAFIVYPTAKTVPDRVTIALKCENLQEIYKKSATECREFIDRLQYMLGKPTLPASKVKKDWDYLLLYSKEETFLFVSEFCYLAGYPCRTK